MPGVSADLHRAGVEEQEAQAEADQEHRLCPDHLPGRGHGARSHLGGVGDALTRYASAVASDILRAAIRV